MALVPDSFIDELLARTDIVEVIGNRVPLKKQGREFSACCPFHDERSPSFTVSPDKQFYHCFGCGAHGTAIGFLMNYDRLEFLDAVDELAKRVGMEVPRSNTQRAQAQTQPLLDVMSAAQNFFRRALSTHEEARQYLATRGVDAATAELFGIGYAPPGFSALRDALGHDASALQQMEKAGLLSRNDRGHVYDKFRHRLMFPIHDRRGRVIAFGGRVIAPEDSPKYLNSPETPLFHKGRELYGLWQVKQAHSRIPRLIVVEGYMDVVMLFQHGIHEAVATLGTATTAEHAELLFRSAADVYFCFDGDAAGRRAAVRAMEAVLPAMRDGRQAFFLFLPEGEDPDTLVRQEGAAGLNARLTQAMPLSQFFFEQMQQDVQLHTLEGKSRLSERVKPWLARLPAGSFADLMQQRLAELTGIHSPAATPARPTHIPRHNAGARPSAQRPSLVRNIITLLVQQPALGTQVALPDSLANLRLEGIPLLLELLACIHQRPNIGTGSLLEAFAQHPASAALNRLATQQLPPGNIDVLRDALAQLEKQALQQTLGDLQARMAEVGLSGLSENERQLLLSLPRRLSQTAKP